MPLHKIEWTRRQCGWAIWRITETEQELSKLASPETVPADIAAPLKRLEWLGGRLLLRQLVEQAGLSYQGLLKDEFGKPSLDRNAHHISLSHSFPYVAAQIDFDFVGIDLEQPKEKMIRIAHRVFNPEEERDAGKDLVKNCVYWCAKEALYKIHGSGGISFAKNLSIAPFTLAAGGIIKGKISIGSSVREFDLAYSKESDYILVRTVTA